MDGIGLIFVLLFLATIYWSLRGFVQLFQRHNAILVIFYLILLFPIAYIHMLILGIFGKSKQKRLEAEVEREIQKRQMVEERIKINE